MQEPRGYRLYWLHLLHWTDDIVADVASASRSIRAKMGNPSVSIHTASYVPMALLHVVTRGMLHHLLHNGIRIRRQCLHIIIVRPRVPSEATSSYCIVRRIRRRQHVRSFSCVLFSGDHEVLVGMVRLWRSDASADNYWAPLDARVT